jgi:two-component system sensor histidine kinase BaeS
MRRWRRLRRRFFTRVAGALLLLFALGVAGCTLLFWLSATLAGAIGLPSGAPPLTGPIVGVMVVALAVLGLTVAARVIRRVALPLGDIMEAAGRVADGDYAARVAEHGPRELRALARAFNSMAARLEKNEEQRRRLLADITHELRTPLTVIQGSLEGLLDGVYPRDDEHLASLLDEAHVLSRLIEDLRTLSLAEAGALVLKREPTDLAALLGETTASFRAQAEAAGVSLEMEAAPDLPLLELDPVRLREVAGNLIANALRYTPRGGCIRLECSLDKSNGDVAVSVSDTGRGIAPEELPHIFDRFYKSADSRGSGLGLAIAKNLVAAHGGEITAESTAGQGTTFRFTLPQMQA